MLANCAAIVVFMIYNSFGAIKKLNSGCMIYKTYIFINSILLSYKNWKDNWKSLTQLS